MLAYVSNSCCMLRRAVGLGLALASTNTSPNVIRPHHVRCAATVMSTWSRGWLQCWLAPPGLITRCSRSCHGGVYDARGKPSDAPGSRTAAAAAVGRHSEMTPQSIDDVESAFAVPDESKAKTRSLLAKARRDARYDEDGEYRVYQELLEGKTTRFVSRVMYDGTNYRGFQLQNNGQPTVQGVLEHALSQRFQKYVPVVAAGRTDTGVHAIGQAVHFDLPNADEDLPQLVYSLNQMMPADVRVWNMTVPPPCSPWQAERGLPWSSMLNAQGKVYSYRLFVGEIPNPLDRLYRVHASHAARAPIDADRLNRAIKLFVGEHDFAGFSNEMDKRTALKKADGYAEFNTRRTVYSADVVDEGGGNLRLVFHLDGALYRMVRNMVGTLLAIAAGRVELDVIDEIFRRGVRDSRRIYAAPALGLTLETVLYDGYG